MRILLLLTLLGVASGAPLPPGIVIDTTPEPDRSFVGSPSIVILPNGNYVASHDFFGAKSPRECSSRVFTSKDRGEHWERIAELPRQFWSTLFVHDGKLYLLGTSGEYGDIQLRRSDDEGHTWSPLKDRASGLLFAGRFHCGPTPVIEQGGRIWRAFEHYAGPDRSWSGRFFRSFMISAPAGADLLDGANWTKSNEVEFDPNWIKGDRTGWLEGNAVPTPEGGVTTLLRINAQPSYSLPFPLDGAAAGIPRFEVAARITISADGSHASFDPASGFFRFPGSQSKFTIRRDPRGGRYWALANKITDPEAGYGPDYSPEWERNVLMLTCSDDLRHWEERTIVLRWREGLPVNRKDQVAFQYPDWQFDGDDIVAVSRTSWGGQSYHNANLLTFHRIHNFRTVRMEDSSAPLDPAFGAAPRPAVREVPSAPSR